MYHLRKYIETHPPSPEIKDAPVIPIPTALNETQRAEQARKETRAQLGNKLVYTHELRLGQQMALRQIGNSAVQNYAQYLENRSLRTSRLKRLVTSAASLIS